MAWLRIDDGFAEHPKILALGTPARRWTWLSLLAYTARQRSDMVPVRASEVIPGATKAFLRDCIEIGLVDLDDEGTMRVHDWHTYNPKDPSAADRMARVRARAPQPQGGRWEKTRKAVFERDGGVCIDCGDNDEEARARGSASGWNADHEPHREVLVARGDSIYDIQFIVTRCHSCHSKKTRREAATLTEHTANGDRTYSEQEANMFGPSSVSRTQERARVPSPTPTPLTQPAAQRQPEDPDPDAAAAALAESGWTPAQVVIAQSRGQVDRAIALLEHAKADPSVRAPGALAWTMFESGQEPPAATATLAAGAQGTRSTKPQGHECPHCGVVKAGPSALEEHIANVHYDRCPKCRVRMARGRTVAQHLYTVHGIGEDPDREPDLEETA